MKRILLVVIVLIIGVPPSGLLATPIQWKAENGGNNNWYDVMSYYDTWENANTFVQTLYWKGIQGHLATITSQQEQNFIWSNFPSGNTFLGGYQTDSTSEPDGNWVWITGEPWGYTNWATNEPNNDFHGAPENYLAFHGDYMHGGWNDVTQSYLQGHSIVEYESSAAPIPEPATGLLLGLGCLIVLPALRRKLKK